MAATAMFPLTPERQRLYDRLDSQIGKTPLYELTHLDVPNECRIFCKGEHKNPTGSSGASLAWLCRVLGFKCRIVIPEDMPAARIQQIRSYGADVAFAEKGMYIGGLVARVRELVGDKERVREYRLTDHSTDLRYGPAAMEDLGTEIVADLAGVEEGPPTYLVCMVGTGISAHGLMNALGPLGTKLAAVEPRESPTLCRSAAPATFRP